MMTNWFGVPVEDAGGGHIPASVKLSFYIGAVAFLAAVVYTVLATKEYPPSDKELAEIRARKFDWTLGLGEIAGLILRIPRRMWELGLVQFFTWIGLFCMWIYFSPAVAKRIFQATPDSPEFGAAVEWAGFCFAVYNAVCFFFSFALIALTKRLSAKLVHTFLSLGRRSWLGLRPCGYGQKYSASLHDRGGHCLGQHSFHALRDGQHRLAQRKHGGLHGYF